MKDLLVRFGLLKDPPPTDEDVQRAVARAERALARNAELVRELAALQLKLERRRGPRAHH